MMTPGEWVVCGGAASKGAMCGRSLGVWAGGGLGVCAGMQVSDAHA